MSHPVIPHTQPMASNALPIAQSVRILRTDGSIQLCSPVELVDNGAMERHRRDPAIVLRECRRSPCDAGRCRFVHFSEVPPLPPPPPPRVVPAQPVVLASQSVPYVAPTPASVDDMLMALQVASQRLHNSLNPGLHMEQSTCCVCYEGLPSTATGYRCNSGHRTCKSCISHYILQNWRTSGNEDVRCLSGDCSSPPMLIADIVRCASKEALAVYIDCYGRAKEAQAFAAAFRIVTDKAPTAAEALADIQQRQLVCSLSRARMCPECKYGPIDFYGCDSLSQHHGEEKNEKSFINNACPRCQFFASDVSSWDHWDGVVRVEEDPAHPHAEANSFTRRPQQGQVDDDEDDDDDEDAYDEYDYGEYNYDYYGDDYEDIDSYFFY